MNIKTCNCSTLLLVIAAVISALALAIAAQAAPQLDARFLKEQPYRKMKQTVDLTGVTSNEDLGVIKDGINPILYFFANLGYLTIPPQHMIKIATPAGAQRLRLPPVDPNRSNGRYPYNKFFNWKVTGDSKITVTAEFRQMIGQLTYTDTFIFVKENGIWKFDRHE